MGPALIGLGLFYSVPLKLGCFDGIGGVIGAAHQRSAFHMPEAQLKPMAFKVANSSARRSERLADALVTAADTGPA